MNSGGGRGTQLSTQPSTKGSKMDVTKKENVKHRLSEEFEYKGKRDIHWQIVQG